VRRLRRSVAVCGCALLAAVLPAAPAAAGASARATSSVRIAEVAPYFEPTDNNPGLLHAAVVRHGLTSFTAAFVLGRKCTPTWDDHSIITGRDARSVYVEKAKAAGATPILSFGGQSGNELAKVCTHVNSLVAAYTAVIRRLGVSRLDFDIEGAGSVNDTATNTRRYRALRALEKKFPKLEISLTLPTTQTGIDADPSDGDGIALLELARTVGVRIDVVNLMTMDYGPAVADMGRTAVTVAKGALTQIKRIWPRSTYSDIGITPMIGKNDSPGETFTYADAQTVVAFAHAHGVHRLAFWSVNRDRACTAADATCSGLAQSPLDYTDAFLG
jgi:hypothetical protein